MRREPPLPMALWDQIPPHTQAAIWVMAEGDERRNAALEAEVTVLKGEIRELKAQRGQNSQNSSRLPSAVGPEVKRKPPRAPSVRKRGSQIGPPVQHSAL